MALFQDEPDEPDGPLPFQAETDRTAGFPLQDEGDEPDVCIPPPAPSSSTTTPMLFQEEGEEVDCDSDSSGFLADNELAENKDKYHELVQLNFATLTKFLESQLGKAAANVSTSQVVKKRRYNNSGRLAKAASAKQVRESQLSANRRIPRNDPDT